MTRRALVVDDSPTDRKLAALILKKHTELEALHAADGEEALEVMAHDTPDVVITDLLMPRMNGLELVAEVRHRFPLVPVILMTGHGSEDIAAEALRKGAASYVPKKNLAKDLAETVQKVLIAAGPVRRKQDLLRYLTEIKATFTLECDPRLIRPLIAHLQEHLVPMGVCDESGRMRVGIALEEALLNALYHGNLELHSEMREDGLDYYKIGDERRLEAPYKDRRIHVRVEVSAAFARYTIRDDGPGFDPSSLPDPRHSEELAKVSGRGLLLVRSFMDEVTFNDMGNEITMVKLREVNGEPPTS